MLKHLILISSLVAILSKQSIAQTIPYTLKKAVVYTTAFNTNSKLSLTENKLSFKELEQPKETQVCVFVDPNKKFQTFVGIGGAITDAAAETFSKLNKKSQSEFLKVLFDKKEGIGYSLLRTNMNSCDFSSSSYTYVNDNDKLLKSFDIAPDKK